MKVFINNGMNLVDQVGLFFYLNLYYIFNILNKKQYPYHINNDYTNT